MKATVFPFFIVKLLIVCSALTSQRMYWTDDRNGTIMSANLNGGAVTTLVTGQLGPSGITLDPIRGKLYWGNFRDSVWQSNLNGLGANRLNGLRNYNHVEYLDVDLRNGSLWFAHWLTGTVVRSGLNGSGPTVLRRQSGAVGIAVDARGNWVYFTDWSVGRSIYRMRLSGVPNPQTLVTSAGWPFDIALDVQRGKMYWTEDRPTGRVMCANLNGTRPTPLVTTGLGCPYGIDVDARTGDVYWVDGCAGKIQRLLSPSRNTDMAVQTIIANQRRPYGLVLDSDPVIEYGTGLAGSRGIIPTMTTGGQLPRVGNSNFKIVVSNIPGGACGFVFISAKHAGIPFLGGTLLINLNVAVSFGVKANGTAATLSLPIPNSTNLLGAVGYFQAGFADKAAPRWVSLTHGLAATVVK